MNRLVVLLIAAISSVPCLAKTISVDDDGSADYATIQKAIDEYLEMGGFLDNGFKAQAELNIAALEKATGTAIAEDVRASLVEQQHQALRWTYIGSGMTHPNFVATLTAMSPAARDRIAEVAPVFC